MARHLTIRDLFTALLLLCLVLLVPFSRAADEGDDLPAGGEEDVFFDEFGDLEEEFDTNAVNEVFDPLSPVNRVVYVFNDRLYFWALKPVARGYRWAVPKGGRTAVRRFFGNLGFPMRFVSNVLQCKLKGAGVETARFGVNTTVGILGFFDPASSWLGWAPPPGEDFGQTLGRYGLGEGFSLMLPILGPSNLRDAVGSVADGFLNPVAYVDPFWIYYGGRTVEAVNDTSLRIGEYESLKEQALDPYTFMRDAYSQYRIKQVGE
jgi:phospholipid-binding lipoprotein MlaA